MLDLYLEQSYTDDRLPLDEQYLQKVGEVALSLFEPQPYELSIVCVDRDESQTLNFTYRQKDKPTNVLSFPSELPDEILGELDAVPLGDLVICVPVVLDESDTQGKTPLDHFTHLVVHGILHLLGYDHELGEDEANEMESLEIEILNKLGIDNPYKDDEY
ncbi:MAG: rRNA maturation RNase YbeY [Moraxella sp.]|nr:rRNA maturation RNase YbeY [Moraxella sp.]